MSRKNIELERCPICGCGMEFNYWNPPVTKPNRNGKHCLWCGNCGLLFGWDIDYGCQIYKKELVAKEWNNGQAFKYHRMWKELSRSILGLKKSSNFLGLSKSDLIDVIKAHMEFLEKEAFREVTEDE